ncbi:SDR family oxidoreductase [Nocardia abscessus]|uniref:SDR family oxidoreductase n=1 Tax=Nocardia abscessus TaxID=120957 RepID=UPI0024584C01|nr:SDR family oxidoreductase [Nocardia abscessus]
MHSGYPLPYPARAPIRTAFVGGGSGGIGAAVATALSASGHRVVLAGRTESRLVDTVSRAGGGDLVDHLVCDLSDPAAAAAAVTEVHHRYGTLDVLIVNAGGPEPGRVLDLTNHAWHEALDLLLVGPLALLRAALPAMADNGFGRCVVVTSSAVKQPQPGLAASTAMRAATTAAAKLASLEYADRGVTVNCVAPGATRTARRLQILEARAAAAGTDLTTEEARDHARVPARRAGDPAEIAAAIAFLASTEAGYVNGTVLTVDGGRTETV